MRGFATARQAALAGLAALGCGGEPPDVLLVSIDTLRADHVGAYGYAAAKTPTLDRLAADGVRFAEAVSPTPLTLPSHASILTGKNPPRHGVRDNGRFRLHEDHVTLAERLRQAGFATGAFVGAFVLDGSYGLDQGFERYDDRMSGERSGAIGYAERSAGAVVDAALAWLPTLPNDAPFFAWVHFYDPHANYEPPPGFQAAAPGRPYDGEIAYVDFQLGRLLAEIESLDRRDLLVIATADHGESLGEHGELTHSHLVYDATQRVPLIASGPGVPRGAVVEAQVRLIDVAPTVLDLLGMSPLDGADGESLVPILRGEGAPARDAYVETLATRSLGWSALYGLRSRGWKYIRAPRPELYDLAADPGERVNRIGGIAAQSPIADEFEARLDALLADAAPAATPIPVDPESRRRLNALGYLVPSDARDLGGAAAPIDPKDGIAAAAEVDALSGLLDRGALVEALTRVQALRQRFPDALLYLEFEALLQLRLGRPQRAAELAARLADASPAHAEAWLLLAEAETARGRIAAAREALDRARLHQPTNPLIARGAVVFELDAGEPAEARRRIDEALASDPEDPDLWVLRGRVEEAEGRTPEARRSYAQVLERFPAHADGRLRLALLEIAGGETEAGLRRLEAVPASQRASLDTALEIARALIRAGEPERALAVLEPFQGPGADTAARLHYLRGAALQQAGDLAGARANLERALSDPPDRDAPWVAEAESRLEAL